jgi:hypothetical protein
VLSYEGQVAITGTAGETFTTVALDVGGSVGVVGVLEGEVRSLSGARIRVEGRPGQGFPGPSVNVLSYEVLEINGQKPYVGVLQRVAETLVLEQPGAGLELSAFPTGLSGAVGAKVWLTGTLSGSRLAVQSYGIIRSR